MTDKIFIDSNIWIYALTIPKDKKHLPKRLQAVELIERIAGHQQIVTSIQIVNEVHWNMVRKFKLADEKVYETLANNIMPIAKVEGIGYSTYEGAKQLRNSYCLSFWDSLVVASAIESGCSNLYSEDLQDGMIIANQLKIINPLK